MAGKTGPNHPRGRKPVDKVRQLQRRLWAAAKRSPGRRFHALYDRIARSDVLAEAWRRVKRNRGAAGVDAQTIASVEQYGVERFLEELGAALKAGTYRPAAVLRRYIPKADGKKRPLGIPTVRDRVAQMAAKLVLEPIFEADFRPSSYGFRPRRSATQALETIRKLGARGSNHVLDADIRDYFRDLNPVLRGWGNYFCTGNAASKFVSVDRYVERRLRGFLVKRKGRNLHAGQLEGWTSNFFHDHGLHRLRGTIQYPEAA
jgi:hypothetical protein